LLTDKKPEFELDSFDFVINGNTVIIRCGCGAVHRIFDRLKNPHATIVCPCGNTLAFNRLGTIINNKRNQAIVKLYQSGTTIEELYQRFRLSKIQLQRIIAEAEVTIDD